MINFNFKSYSLTDTFKFAKQIAEMVKPNFLIFLEGDLGSGKTAFTKAFCKALKVKTEVSSPTFVLCKNYEGKNFTINHYDLYRLNNASEILDLNINENLDEGNIILIEWPDIARQALRKPDMTIKIERLSENLRCFNVFMED